MKKYRRYGIDFRYDLALFSRNYDTILIRLGSLVRVQPPLPIDWDGVQQRSAGLNKKPSCAACWSLLPKMLTKSARIKNIMRFKSLVCYRIHRFLNILYFFP